MHIVRGSADTRNKNMIAEKESVKDIKSDGDEELASESASSAAASAAVLTFEKTAPKVSFEFIDHFSLNKPSSTIRSRGVTTRIYDVDNNQLGSIQIVIISLVPG